MHKTDSQAGANAAALPKEEKSQEEQVARLGDSRGAAVVPQPDQPSATIMHEGQEADDTVDVNKEGSKDETQRPTLGRAPSVLKDPSKVPGNRWKTLLAWCSLEDVFLENTASVARDHLANERSYLAWLRTSITLASIGVGECNISAQYPCEKLILMSLEILAIVIAQLFRLSSSVFTLSEDPFDTIGNLSKYPTSNDGVITASDLSQVVAQLVTASQKQNEILLTLLAAQKDERHRYQHLGKPLGATFLMISVLFVALGNYRYLSVQHFLTANNYFPPARRSVLISASAMLALTVTTFSLILVLK